jgi:hypothetical protein
MEARATGQGKGRPLGQRRGLGEREGAMGAQRATRKAWERGRAFRREGQCGTGRGGARPPTRGRADAGRAGRVQVGQGRQDHATTSHSSSSIGGAWTRVWKRAGAGVGRCRVVVEGRDVGFRGKGGQSRAGRGRGGHPLEQHHGRDVGEHGRDLVRQRLHAHAHRSCVCVAVPWPRV